MKSPEVGDIVVYHGYDNDPKTVTQVNDLFVVVTEEDGSKNTMSKEVFLWRYMPAPAHVVNKKKAKEALGL